MAHCCNSYCGFVKIVAFTFIVYFFFEKYLDELAKIHNFAIKETLIAEKRP